MYNTKVHVVLKIYFLGSGGGVGVGRKESMLYWGGRRFFLTKLPVGWNRGEFENHSCKRS
jgi:hypothetical protein